MAKYDALCTYLKKQTAATLILTFSEIEKIIGAKLPHSAHKYSMWWENETNEKTRHVQCGAWLDAGYRAFLNRPTKNVTFRKRGK